MLNLDTNKLTLNPKYFVVCWSLAAFVSGLFTLLLLWLINYDPMNLRGNPVLYLMYLSYFIVYGSILGFFQAALLRCFLSLRTWWLLS